MKKVAILDLHQPHTRAALVVIISIMGEEKRALLQKSQQSTLSMVYMGQDPREIIKILGQCSVYACLCVQSGGDLQFLWYPL